MSIQLEYLLRQIPDDTESRVDQIRKRAGTAIREAIRQETGLFLRRQSEESGRKRSREENISVPVSLEPGMPESLSHVEFQDDFQIIAILCRYRTALQQSIESSGPLERLFEELLRNEYGASVLAKRQEHLPPLKELVEQLLDILDKKNPVRRILEVNEDVMGVYWYRLPRKDYLFDSDPMSGRVILYWAVIGLIASLLDVPIEDLAVVVLCHEIAHAYSHLGADIDGERWNSNAFASSEHDLKEGLAQYYTHRLCLRLQNQFPYAHAAYDKLLNHQPPAYKTHKRWIDKHTAEEVRLAMLETRRKGTGKIQAFNSSLKAAESTLRAFGGDEA